MIAEYGRNPKRIVESAIHLALEYFGVMFVRNRDSGAKVDMIANDLHKFIDPLGIGFHAFPCAPLEP